MKRRVGLDNFPEMGVEGAFYAMALLPTAMLGVGADGAIGGARIASQSPWVLHTVGGLIIAGGMSPVVALAGLHPERRDACICAIGDDSKEASIICTALLRQMGAQRVVSRAGRRLTEPDCLPYPADPSHA